MRNKGKFGLLSYIIEDNLIFYKSLNKKKIMAFSLMIIDNIYKIILFFNSYLTNHFIDNYSVQFDTNYEKAILILNLQNNDKKEIIRNHNSILNELDKKNLNVNILQENGLETRFIDILSEQYKNDSKLSEKKEYLLLKDNKAEYKIYGFDLKLNSLEPNNSFIPNIIQLITPLIYKGYIIFNFSLNKASQICINAYFICLLKSNKDYIELKEKVNQFYNCNLLEDLSLNIKNFFKILWRVSFSDNTPFLFKKSKKIFLLNYKESSIKINGRFVEKLKENFKNDKIRYVEINENLFLVKERDLYLILDKIDFKLIFKLIKKFYSKYFIYIITISEKVYQTIMKVEKINLLKRIKIINPKELEQFLTKNSKKNQKIPKSIAISGAEKSG